MADLQRLISDTPRGLSEKKNNVMSNIQNEKEDPQQQQEEPSQTGPSRPFRHSPTEALKLFFDRIPVFSVPGVNNEQVVEVSSFDCMGDAILGLYKANVMGAPVRDQSIGDTSPLRDRYIGLVEFSGMVLWALQEFEVAEAHSKSRGLVLSSDVADFNGKNTSVTNDIAQSGLLIAEVQGSDFFATLDQYPSIKSCKIEAMSRYFRWGPYLPVTLEDSLLHVLLLLSKHRLKAVPVVDQDEQQVRGFITQDAAVQLLLQCSGLEWFDIIAEKKLSEFRFEVDYSGSRIVQLFSDDSVQNAMMCMWKDRLSGVPVVDRKTRKLLGNIRNADVRILLENSVVFRQRRVMSVDEFLKLDTPSDDFHRGDLEQELSASISAATLSLANISLPRMQEPVTSTRNETLKTTMEKLVKSRSDRCFLIDDELAVIGVITLRDIIIQFAPPYVDGPEQWGGFFQSALQQTGTVMQSGSLRYEGAKE